MGKNIKVLCPSSDIEERTSEEKKVSNSEITPIVLLDQEGGGEEGREERIFEGN
ncbi:MAG: hypothetical protein WC447_02255 [Candidatus Paceibacterota bacterium]|jgi:hypothetical protein